MKYLWASQHIAERWYNEWRIWLDCSWSQSSPSTLGFLSSVRSESWALLGLVQTLNLKVIKNGQSHIELYVKNIVKVHKLIVNEYSKSVAAICSGHLVIKVLIYFVYLRVGNVGAMKEFFKNLLLFFGGDPGSVQDCSEDVCDAGDKCGSALWRQSCYPLYYSSSPYEGNLKMKIIVGWKDSTEVGQPLFPALW